MKISAETLENQMFQKYFSTTYAYYAVSMHIGQACAQEESPFGDTIAHGLLALSVISHFREQCFPKFPSNATGMVYGFDNIRFINPAPVNSRLRGVYLC